MSVNDPTPDPVEWTALAPDERARLRATPSTNLVLAALAVGTAVLVIMSVVVGFFLDVAPGRAVSVVGLAITLGLLVAAYAVTETRDYLLTDERAYTAVGLTEKRVAAIDLDDVRDVRIDQPGWQRLVNVGTVRFVTDDGDLTFALVENPTHLRERALRFVDRED